VNIEITARSGRSVELRPTGELDLSTAPELRGVLRALTAHEVEQIVLDASDISFIDASGLTPLIEVAGEVQVAVHRPSRQVRRLLQLCDLDAWLVRDGGNGSSPDRTP
jgi:anti-anti-sigma factor